MQRWLHLPVSEGRLTEILTGQMTCLDALMYPEDGFIYVLDDNVKDESRTRTVLAEPSALPEDSLPYPDARFDYDLPEEASWMELRERAHLLDIRFHSRVTTDRGSVSARTVGKTISEMQGLVDAIGQELGQRVPNMMGRIPEQILEQTRLNPVSAYSGSFGIRLESHGQDGMSGTSLIRSSLDRLYDLLEAVADPEERFATSELTIREPKPSEPYISRDIGASYVTPGPRPGVEECYAHTDTEVDSVGGDAAQWPGPRVRKHLESLLYSMATFPGEVTLSWVKPPPDQVRKVTLKPYGLPVQMVLRRAALSR